jgi:hypothetical protein
MPSTIINEFTIEPRPLAGVTQSAPAAAPAAKSGGGKGSPEMAREIERVLHHDRHRALRLWTY